jgi:hypothetical protein
MDFEGCWGGLQTDPYATYLRYKGDGKIPHDVQTTDTNFLPRRNENGDDPLNSMETYHDFL